MVISLSIRAGLDRSHPSVDAPARVLRFSGGAASARRQMDQELRGSGRSIHRSYLRAAWGIDRARWYHRDRECPCRCMQHWRRPSAATLGAVVDRESLAKCRDVVPRSHRTPPAYACRLMAACAASRHDGPLPTKSPDPGYFVRVGMRGAVVDPRGAIGLPTRRIPKSASRHDNSLRFKRHVDGRGGRERN
jgi:hypothetical protein